MSGEKTKLSLQEDEDFILERSIDDRYVDEKKIRDRAIADTDIVMSRHRKELRDSILEMTKSA